MLVSISQEQAYAYAEILEILSFTNPQLTKKIPKQLIKIFKDNASSIYKYHLNRTVPLEDQDISQETAALLTLISLNYWCETEDEKNEIRKILSENERKLNEEIKEKYHPDKIFNNYSSQVSIQVQETNEDIITNTSSNLPIDINQIPWYKKILVKINKLLSKYNKKTTNPA